MTFISTLNSRRIKRRLFNLLFVTGCCLSVRSYAHQTPTTIATLDISPAYVTMQLELPLTELELAFGHDVTKNPETIVERLGPQFKEYLKAHIHPFVNKEHPWKVDITGMHVEKAVQMQSGPPFQEIIVQLLFTPNKGENTRNFTLDYDVIIHQVLNHAAFVSVRNDWETGKSDTSQVQVGVIRVDGASGVIFPLKISLAGGSWWTGFLAMVSLGMEHIREGTDHLLFLIVLLLPAMLLVDGNQWGSYGGARYSMLHLLKIVTAFTIGHSITLMLGAAGWLRLPVQPVETLIAFSILVSAAHAAKPLFPGKEEYVAGGFGLIHGSAFATVLANLNLGPVPMAISILGFNIGIELMQLIVIALIVPWLFILSQSRLYPAIKLSGALLSSIAALGWIIERITGNPNLMTIWMAQITKYLPFAVIALAVMSLISYSFSRKKITS